MQACLTAMPTQPQALPRPCTWHHGSAPRQGTMQLSASSAQRHTSQGRHLLCLFWSSSPQQCGTLLSAWGCVLWIVTYLQARQSWWEPHYFCQRWDTCCGDRAWGGGGWEWHVQAQSPTWVGQALSLPLLNSFLVTDPCCEPLRFVSLNQHLQSCFWLIWTVLIVICNFTNPHN